MKKILLSSEYATIQGQSKRRIDISLDTNKLPKIEHRLRMRGFLDNITVTMSDYCLYGQLLHSYSTGYLIDHGWSQYIALNVTSKFWTNSNSKLCNICLGQICKTADQLVLDGHYEEALDIVMAVMESGIFAVQVI